MKTKGREEAQKHSITNEQNIRNESLEWRLAITLYSFLPRVCARVMGAFSVCNFFFSSSLTPSVVFVFHRREQRIRDWRGRLKNNKAFFEKTPTTIITNVQNKKLFYCYCVSSGMFYWNEENLDVCVCVCVLIVFFFLFRSLHCCVKFMFIIYFMCLWASDALFFPSLFVCNST